MSNRIDFKKYKNCLKELLRNYNFNVNKNPTNCINPSHKDSNPSMLLYDDYFHCQSCDVKGDIFDAIGLLEGIGQKIDQYKRIDEIFGSGNMNYHPNNKKKVFEIDKQSENKLREYLASQNGIGQKHIKDYLNNRRCPQEMIDKLSICFGFWPGFDQAIKDLGKETIKGAGIPLLHPETKKSSWHQPGITVKLGTGFKLFYFDENGKSMKIGSKKCKTFPFPRLPDSDHIYIVEGEMSAVSMLYAGYLNTVAAGGVNGLNDNHIKQLLIYDKIYIVFDGDKAGRKNRERLREKLLKNGYTGDVFIVRLPDGQDPDDVIKDGNEKVIEDAIIKSEKKNNEINNIPPQENANKIKYDNSPFIFAGYDESLTSNYYIVPKNQNIALRIGRTDSSIKNIMLDIAPYNWWLEKFPKYNKEGKTSLDIHEAISWFRYRSQSVGIFREENMLGVGAHIDKDDIIVNLGDALYSQKHKKRIEYIDYEGNNIYKRSAQKFDISGDPWTRKQAGKLFNEITNYGLSKSLDYILLCGFIALAPFASVLHRRPHLALIGQKGSGKTSIIQNIIRPAIGELGIFVEGKTSEAGIRQKIGSDCRPTIIDEFEAHNSEEQARNKNILSLARSAYGGEGEIIKGSVGQKPIIFKTKIMFLFAAINIVFDNDAERSRIPIIKMKKSLKKIGKEFDFSGLRRRMFNKIKDTLKNIKLAKEYLVNVKGYDDRTGDTYGTLIAGFWSMVSDCDFLKDDIEDINECVTNAVDQIEENKDEIIQDEENLLNVILNYKIKITPIESKTISEMLMLDYPNDSLKEGLMYSEELKQIGIRRDKNLSIEGKSYDCLAISSNNQYIRQILQGTPFQEYKNILVRHPASIFDNTRTIRMIAGKRERCIILDWNEMFNIHFFNDDIDNPF